MLMTIKRLHEKLKPDFYVYVAQEISSRETGCSHEVRHVTGL